MIMQKTYLEDLKEHVRKTPETSFAKFGYSKEEILSDKNGILDSLWTRYQKNVEEFGCDPDFSCLDALFEEFGVEL